MTPKPGARRPAAATPGGRRNTVGLSPVELANFLDRLEGAGDPGAAGKRDFVRWPFRHVSVPMRIFHPGGSAADLTVACRNISRGGMAVLHSSYIHPGTKCALALPRPGRSPLAVNGYIVRCAHRSGLVHEIGVRFEEPVDLRTLLSPEPFSNWFSLERVRPEDLRGAVLCVDNTEIDRTILKHYLRDTLLAFREASSVAQAVEIAAAERCDLVISEFILPDGTGADLIERLTAAGQALPVLIATSDTGPEARARYASVPAAAFIAKPVAQEMLLRAIGEFLLADSPGDGVSTVPPNDPAAPLVEQFVAALRNYADRLDDAARRNDVSTCRTICLQIAGSAPSLGFRGLGELGRAAADSLSRTQNATESIAALRALEAACRRARAQTAA